MVTISRIFALADLRQMVGVILQDVFILQDTLLANIIMDTDCTREKVEQILTQTGIDRFSNKLPQGLDTQIGEGGLGLSTGEKQLLAFARFFAVIQHSSFLTRQLLPSTRNQKTF